MKRTIFLIPLVTAGCASQSSAPSTTITISRKTMGNNWPFSVDSGNVSCDGSALYFSANNETYALNGVALSSKSARDIAKSGFWLDNKNVPGLKVSLDAVMQKAKGACPA